MSTGRPVALVTGCSSGIGAALARALVAAGYDVFASARRPESLTALAGTHIHPLALDVTDAESRTAAIGAIQDQAGRLDLLINNAGFGQMGPVSTLTTDQLRAQFETNVIAPVALTQAALPLLRAAGGTVCNIGSVSGLLVTPFAGAYCASKAALHAVDEALRLELSPLGVHVVTVQPGGVASDFGSRAGALLDTQALVTSPYAPIADRVQARADASQAKAEPADVAAQRIVTALRASPPPAVVRVGTGGRLYAWMARWLPAGLRRRLLAKQFGLHQLARA